MHLFYIENKSHSALGFSSFEAKQKINFKWSKFKDENKTNTFFMYV